MSTTPDYDNLIWEFQANQTGSIQNQHHIRMMYLVTYGVVVVLGVILNFIFMLFGCLKHKRYMKIAVWVLALAVAHLIFCGAVVFQFLYAYYDFEWHYGVVTCKLSSYVSYGNMYCTATMLSLWSFSSTFLKSACFKRCKNCNIYLILFSWTLAAVLAMPSLFSREVQKNQCVDDYDFDDFKTTPYAMKKLKTVVVLRFLFGLVIPAFVMSVSCCMASKSFHIRCNHCKKQARIICAVKIAYFVCWGPQIFLTLLQATANIKHREVFQYGLPASTALATTHCITCPLIYILLGRSIKMHWMVHDPDHTDDIKDERIPL